ncbi:MAG: hypothetical protein KKD30_05320 [Gammaproteobacteria bacterium]|nr:hypothetical protein [Gammaproteobacteria bacterium]MBU1859362.1 hypothetical protein [Gammaproteobacteria bacterium]
MPLEFAELIGWAISLLSIFTTVVFGLVKLLLNSFEKRLAERFAAQDEARKAATRHWEDSFAKVLERQDKDAEALAQLDRAFLRFQAELPVAYVRREDWARGQSVIEAKLDGLALRYENILLTSAQRSTSP